MSRLVTAVAVTVLALAAPLAAHAAAPASTTVYVPATAGSDSSGPYASAKTGVVLAPGDSVSVTATGLASCAGSICYFDPNGHTDYSSSFLAPWARMWSLIGRVGSGPWQFVGVGPTLLTGVGEVSFAFNDDFFGDNEGGWTVTVGFSAALVPPEAHPSVPTASYCAPTSRGWTFLQVSPGQLEAGFWDDAIESKSTVAVAGQNLTFTGEEPVLAALVPALGLTCDQPWFTNGTYADSRYGLRGEAWEAAFAAS
jgi:hypothetical protein